MTPDCPLIEISGTPFERGVMYGKKARGRIILGVTHYTKQLRENAFGADELGVIVKKILPYIEAFGTQLVDEMRGIVSGAEIAFKDIALLYARTEILQLAALRAGKTEIDEEPDSYTGVVILPAATRARSLIHAQNWDWKHEFAETAVVLRA